MSQLINSTLAQSQSPNQSYASPIKANSSHYGKAGLVATTKKEIIPVDSTQTNFVEKVDYKITPVKKFHYVEGHGVIDYMANEVQEVKSQVPYETKTTEYYEVETDHMKCPITDIESPSHGRRVKKVGGNSGINLQPSSQVQQPPSQLYSSGVQSQYQSQYQSNVKQQDYGSGSKVIKQTFDTPDATHHIMASKKIVPIQKSTYVPGHGVVSYTQNEFQDFEEVVTIPKERQVDPLEAQSIIQGLRAWIKARKLNVDDLYKQFDYNQDGKLQYEELSKLFRSVNPSISEGDTQKCFKFFDANKDGVVDSHEFKTLLKYD